jgi:hypothetical protein
MMRTMRKLAIISLALLFSACSLPGDMNVPTQTTGKGEQAESLEMTAELRLTDEVPTTSQASTEEPPTEFIAPPTEPPGELEPALRRIQSGAELVIQHVMMIDLDIGWAIGGTDGRADSVLRTDDGCMSWIEVSPPEAIEDSTPMMAVGSFLNATTAWILYHPVGDSQPGRVQDLRIWHTDDAGENWRASAPVSVEFVGADHSPAWAHFEDTHRGWVLARYGGSGMHRYPVYLLQSEDRGETWHILEDPYEGMWLQSCPKTGWDWSQSGMGIVTIGFCPFESAEIHISKNSGQSWTSIRLPFPPGEEERFGSSSCEAHSPIIFAENDLMLASECTIWSDDSETMHLLYTSEDQGDSWEIMEYPGGELLHTEGDVLLALGRDLYRSQDRGFSWTLLKQVAWDGEFSFVGSDNGWAVARNEDEIAFVRTVDGGITWQLVEPALSQ